ncbi:MAG: hypothetical protein M5U26_18945 [Planctomycetota bacterium]|nr:hypothetical protein [Planctomycetota bacterium]
MPAAPVLEDPRARRYVGRSHVPHVEPPGGPGPGARVPAQGAARGAEGRHHAPDRRGREGEPALHRPAGGGDERTDGYRARGRDRKQRGDRGGGGELGLRERPRSVPDRQACAAAGQVALMHWYAQSFRKQKPPRAVGQLLLTRDGLEDRVRYLNARHTLEALFERGAVPVVNENDTVSVDEIRFGDNDRLSALVAVAAEAQALVILTDVEALLEAPPAVRPGAARIPWSNGSRPRSRRWRGRAIRPWAPGGW